MKNVLILGAGISGLGAAHVLLSHGASVTISDLHDLKNEKEKQELAEKGAKFAIGPQADVLLKGKDTVVVSPVVPRENPVVAAALAEGIPVVSEVELAYRVAKAPILAVTGTNGKTTTTSLLGEMLKASGMPYTVAGNIGESLSLEAEKIPAAGCIAAELSSFQLEFIDTFRPKAAAILNITPDHLERHHTMEAYAAAKGRIFENMTEAESLLLNADDPFTEGFLRKAKAHVYRLSSAHEVEEGAFLRDGALILRIHGEETALCREEDMKLRGRHNMENALAAAFLARMAGVSTDAIRHALLSYTAMEHRIEYVRTLGGVDYYNDSKGTNTDAAEKAVAAFKGPVILIAGGYDKGTPIEEFMAFLAPRVKALVLLGAAAERFRGAAIAAGIGAISMVSSMKEAVECAKALAEAGDTVLLSPACSSFDMYKSYGERGRDFKKIVADLAE